MIGQFRTRDDLETDVIVTLNDDGTWTTEPPRTTVDIVLADITPARHDAFRPFGVGAFRVAVNRLKGDVIHNAVVPPGWYDRPRRQTPKPVATDDEPVAR